MEGILYSQIYSIKNLLSAWDKIKNKGSAGGIDNISIDIFGKNLEVNLKEISNLLSSNHYIPEPYKEINIPKNDDEFRSLSLPTIRDKIVQQVVKDVIEPILEKEFLDVSYAYRINKGATKAINRVSHLITNEMRPWVTLCDVDNYFDNVHHDLLFTMFYERIKDENLLAFIKLWVKMGKVDKRLKWKDTIKGIPQGGIVSPLLSNLYLHSFDQIMVERRFGYVRYADDFLILSHSESEAYRALKDTKWFLEKKLMLHLNPGACVKNIQEGFEFLGILFQGNEKTITEKKIHDLKEKISQAIDIKDEESITKLSETVVGISRYYGKFVSSDILEELDEWMINCLKEYFKKSYQDGTFHRKSEIEIALTDVSFLSQKYQLFKNRIIKSIIIFCHKRKKDKEKIDAVAVTKRDPIKKKKREYQKLESAGFELLITKPGIFIGKSKRGISVKERGVKQYEAPLLNLKNITILSSGVTLSSNVIRYCAEKKIPIDFVDFNGIPYARLYSFEASSTSIGIAQLKALENGKALAMAKYFVSGKIKNQINLIKYYSKYRKGRDEDFTEIFDEKITAMESLAIQAVKIAEKDIEILRGKLFSIEGRAASCYWEMIETILNENIEFEGRVRKGATDLVNSLLNYGYGILYSRIWEAILLARLNPYISYLHKPQEGKPTLVFDLIEEFRQQIVDKAIFPLITKGESLEVEKGFLTNETKKKVVENVFERLHTIEKFRGKEMRLSEIIKEQAKAVAEFLEGKIKNYRCYIGKW